MATTPYLGKFQFGGTIYDNASGGSPVEIWSCSVHMFVDATGLDPAGQISSLTGPLNTWFNSANARISPTVSLDYAKWNEIDVTTGKQVTDPTVETIYALPSRGGGGSA